MSALTDHTGDSLRDEEARAALVRGGRTILGWIQDGTLAFASADQREKDVQWQGRLATSYQQQFADNPQLVAAIDNAYRGQPSSETVRLEGGYWDVRLWPVAQSGRLGGVVAILTDASDRIAAHRARTTLELMASIRYRLARSDSVEEFLAQCCKTIEALDIAAWIGVVDPESSKRLSIVAGTGAYAASFRNLDLSWDIASKTGRHPPAEAIRTGRVQMERDVKAFADGEAWIDPQLPWNGLLAIPLRGNGALPGVGVLVIHSDADDHFDAEMVRLWEQTAREIAEGIELLRHKDEHRRLTLERQGAYQQYQRLFDTIFDIVIVHRNGRVLEINPAGVKLLEAASAEEIVGSQVLTLIDPAHRESMRETLHESIASDNLREFRVMSLTGRSIDVEGLTVSVSHEGSSARLSHWRDISERKRVENLILQQKMSLEYAQQVVQSGSVEVDCLSGKAEWSRNALAIMGLTAERVGHSFAQTVAALVCDADRAAVAALINGICQQVTSLSCEVTLRSDDPSGGRTLYIHGIPQVEHHTSVSRIFIVVQDISRFRNAERALKAKLAATWRLAKVAEWTYEIDKQIIIFHGDQKDFLGYESPVTSITFEQFIGSIRKEDREEVSRAVARSLRQGSDGEVVYEEQFHHGTRLLLYTRWVPERGEDGRIVRFRGLSLDISRVRQVQQREAPKAHIGHHGIPGKEMAYSRLHQLATHAANFGFAFSVIQLKVLHYRSIKRELASETAYIATHKEVARRILESLPDIDTFAKQGEGRFLIILRGRVSEASVDLAAQILRDHWRDALRRSDSPLAQTIAVQSSVTRSPEDGTDWEELLSLLEQRLGPPLN